MDRIPLPKRTKSFAVRVIRLYNSLQKRGAVLVIGNQLLRSGTSVGAHCRMELLIESEAVKAGLLEPLMAEANELMAITVKSVRTVKSRRR